MKPAYYIVPLAFLLGAVAAFSAYTFLPNLGQREIPKNNTFKKIDQSLLSEARPTQVVDLKDGDSYDLTVTRVKKKIGKNTVTLLAYNGSVPGPVIRTTKGASVKIRLTNNLGDLDTTLHPHGVRVEEAFDGIPPEQGGITPVSFGSGNTVEYTLKFPDAGAFWYHPHIRDDIGQGMGLYGNFIVTDAASGFTNSVNREEYLFISDILIKKWNTAAYPKDKTNYAIMGRYGNTLLLNGTDKYSLQAKRGDVIRFYLTNAASVRTFNISITGAKVKLVGSDVGKYGKEAFQDSVRIAPAERYIVEAYFEKAGDYKIVHKTPEKSYTIGSVKVSDASSDQDYSKSFAMLKSYEEVVVEMAKFEPYYAKKADKNLSFSLDMDEMGNMGNMHGMSHGGMDENHISADGIEWEDTMGPMNAISNSDMVTWQINDTDTNQTNADIDWKFKKGDLVKISIVNETGTTHPMQHPFHMHGQRFIVLSENGKRVENPVWKDTVLVPSGQPVEILVDMSNPGSWMAHCHITEHLHSGMGFGFKVEQ